MAEIIWIFGATAVGKKTFILKSAKTKKTLVPNETNRKCVIPIIVYVPDNRNSVFEEILNIKNDKMEFLIHGQNTDIRTGLLKKLKKKYPNRFKYCYYMFISENTFNKRLKKRNAQRIKNNDKPYNHTYDVICEHKKKYLPILNEIFDEVIVLNQ